MTNHYKNMKIYTMILGVKLNGNILINRIVYCGIGIEYLCLFTVLHLTF
jgi:hypothetical protein